MQIRSATLNDVANMSRIEAICFPEEEAAKLEQIEERVKAYGNHFLVLEIEGEIVGFINGMVTDEETIGDEMYEEVQRHKEDGKWQSIFGLDVLPRYRRIGYAARLMEAFIEQARCEHRLGCILTCKEYLVPYYEKFGYQNKGVSQSVHGGARWYDMVLIF